MEGRRGERNWATSMQCGVCSCPVHSSSRLWCTRLAMGRLGTRGLKRRRKFQDRRAFALFLSLLLLRRRQGNKEDRSWRTYSSQNALKSFFSVFDPSYIAKRTCFLWNDIIPSHFTYHLAAELSLIVCFLLCDIHMYAFQIHGTKTTAKPIHRWEFLRLLY